MIFALTATVFLVFIILLITFDKTFSPALKYLLVLVFLAGIFYVYNPEKLDSLARYIGVELGSDLIFYLSTMLFIYAVLVFYHKFVNQSRKIEKLVRFIAIDKAATPDKKD